ncbi:Ig-like domain-containing protein [Pedobacter insulae]|uniref:Gliding motility-associated C-terminal domain-containing protein n=1 Tax=Pedobacter insulae TaxID=414048 RepID=A0A1I3AD75_9SPHI|nr:putative Ig domain-containing protein [Pedobacter insulae]SFH48037.1 gliding motility-associated C-terminal domain-containing protein [Pedobacter insulae]
MKLTSTSSKWSTKWILFSLFVVLLTLNFSKSYAQRVYATTTNVKSITVDNPSFATDANTANFATVKSYGGALLGFGKYSGELELVFPSSIPANKTTYIRIDFDEDVLNLLLQGNLGSLLANVVGGVALGNHYFTVGARNGNTPVPPSGSSSGAFSNSNLRIVKDAAGLFYIAIKPTAAYDRVYIKDNTDALLLGANNETKVYNAFYASGAGSCDPAFATDYDGAGLTASLLGIGKAGVTNPEFAIDNNSNTASQVGLGLISVVGSISQNIYFAEPTVATDELNIKMSVDPTLVTLGLLNNVLIETYLGDNLVSSNPANTLLNLDLLTLLGNGQPIRLAVAPGALFDRARITVTSLVGVNIAQNINLFSVTRTAPRPTFTGAQSNAPNSCYNSTNILAATTAAGNQLVWYDVLEGGTALATTASTGTYTTPALTANKTYYVAAKKPGCEESIRVPINITVNPTITFTTTTLNNGAVGSTYNKQITAATGGTPGFTYSLAPGSSLPAGLSLATNGTISGTPTVAGTSNFSIVATDSKNCTVTTPFSIVVNNAMALGAATLPNGMVGKPYPSQVLPAATGGTSPYTYTATGLPPGLSFNPTTRAITGTPTTAGPYTVTLKATDNAGNFITKDYPLTIAPALALASGPLPNGTINEVYPTQTLAEATGGTGPYTYGLTGLPAGLTFNPATREISGTPTVAGISPLVLTATDADGNIVTANYSLTIGNVNGSPDCNAANSQSSGISGGVCVLCSINNPSNSVDGNKTNFTRISLPVALLNVEAFQVLNFPSAGQATDKIRLDLGTPVGLTDLSVLSNITVTVMNGATVVSTHVLNSGLINLQLLSGNRFIATVPTGGAFDRVEVRIKALVGALGNYDIYGAAINYASPVVATPGLTACFGSTTTLNATPNAGTTLAWFADLAGGTALATGNTLTTPALTTNKTYYIEVTRAGCTDPVRTPVNVVVNPNIVFAATTLNNGAIGTPYSKQIDAAVGGTPAFTYALAPGSSLPAGLSLAANGTITGTPTTLGTSNFSIVATDSKSCSVTTAFTMTITNTPLALASGPLPDGTINELYPTQTLAGATGGTGPYTYGLTGLPAGLTFNPVTREITGTPTVAGIFPLILTATDANSNTVTANYSITVANVNGSPDCNAANSQSNGITGGICVLCSINNPNNSVDGNKTNFTRISLPVALLNVEAFQALNFASAGQAGDKIRLDLATPVGLADLSVLSNITVNVMNGATVVNSYVLNSSLIDLQLLSGNRFIATVPATGAFNKVEVRIKALVGALGNYDIYGAAINYAAPTVAAAGLTACSGSTTTLSATPNAGTTLAWFATLTGGTALATGNSFTTPILTSNKTYYIEVSRAGCVDPIRVPVDVTVTPVLAVPSVPATAAVCNGSPAVLAVNNPDATITYRWYEAATGGTSIFSGATYTTPVLVANKTYYVEASKNGCVSATRAAVAVTVGTRPNLPIVTTNAVTISSGQNTTLQATTDVGNTLNWYNAPTAGVLQGTGTSFTTPNLTTNTTYYVEAVNATGCSSATRVAVTVTVTGGSGSPDCNAANSQSSGITGGICVLCTINNPTNSVDGDKTNFTRITLPVALLNVEAFQVLNFSSTGQATDHIRLDLGTPVGLADLSVLSNITINVMNGATVVSTYALNSSLINLQLLSGNRFIAMVPAGGAFDRVEIRIKALVGALGNYDIYGASIIYAAPTVSTAGLTTCSGSTTTLTATPNGGTTLAWFANATGGVALATGNTFNTPALTVNTTYYIEVSRAGCANPERVPVEVTVTPVLAMPVIPATAAVCAGSPAVLAVTNPDATITYRWYEAATGGVPVFSGATFTTPALTANKTYYVEASKNGCVSASRAAVVVTVSPRPVLPVVQASATTISAGQSVVLTATSSDATAIYKWYPTAVSTTPVYTGSTYVTPPLLTTTSYFVEASFASSGCVSSSRVMITITVDGNGPNPVPCESAITQTNGVNGIALLAGVSNAGLAIDADSKTSSTLFMPVGLLNASVYQRLGFGGSSNIGDKVSVLITSPGKLLSLALLGSVELSTSNGGVNNNDALVSNNALIDIQLLSGNTQALLTFTPAKVFDAVEVKLNSGLVGALTSIGVNYAQRVIMAPEVDAASVSACLNQPATLSVKNPKANLTYKWYNAAGVYQAGKDGVTFVTPSVTANTSYFVAASSASGCISAQTEIKLTLTGAPILPELVAPNVTVCAGTAAILQVKNPVPGITYKWYDGTGVYQAGKDGPTFTIASVTTTATYQVEAVNSCGTASARATATVKPGTLDLPLLNPPSTTISTGTSAILTASSSSPGAIFNWYASANSTTILATGSTFVTPILTATTTYYVEAIVPGGCPASGRASVTVTVVPNGPPVVTPCGTATIAIADGVNGVALLAGVSNPNLAVDNFAETGSTLRMPVGIVGAYVYQRIGFAGGLSNVGDLLKISITSPGKLLSLSALPSINVVTYNGGVSNNDLMAANNPLINVELLSDNSAIILTYAPTSRFDGVEVRLNSGLVGALTSINLNYAQRSNVAPKVNSNNLSTCEGTSTLLNVKDPIAGVVYKWYLGNVYQTGKDGVSFTTDASLPAGTYTYNVTAFAKGCESAPTPITVVVLIRPVPPVPSPSNPATTCVGTSATLSVQAVNGITFNWYDANGGLLALNTRTYTTPASLAAGAYTFNVEAVNANTCTSSTRTSISLTVGSGSTAADIQLTGARSVCNGSTGTITATSTTVINPVFTWYSNANLTTPIFTGATFITPVLTANATYYVTVKGSNKCENGVGAAAIITFTVNPPAIASDITLSGATTICGGSSAVLTASSTTVTNPVFKWYSNASLTTLVYTGATFTTPVLNANTTYYVTVSGDNKCENSSANAKAAAIVVNSAPNAPVIAASGTSICTGNATILTVQNPQTGITYEFYSAATGGTALGTGTSFTTPVLNANTDYYVQAVNSTGCSNAGGRVKVTVTVSAKPGAPTVASATISSCVGSTAVITVSNPQTGVTYSYYTAATGGTAVGTGNTFTTPALTTTTIYYVEASVGTCSSTTRTAVTVNIGAVLATPVLSVQSKTVSSIIFSWNVINGATGYEISLDGGTTWQVPSSGANGTTHTVSGLTANQSVTITVRAKGQASCQTSANATPLTERTDGQSTDLYVPNTFTPNGDGNNDIFLAYGNTVSRYKMRVYNQWGQFVFESNSLNTGWDGTFKGSMQPTGVYVYYIDVTFTNGQTKMIKGTITLLR